MSMTAKGVGTKAVRLANAMLNLVMLTVILLLTAFGGYALWDTNQIYQAADAARYEIYKPTGEEGGRSFLELTAINPEVFAWLSVYGTNIDYPVTQGEDNLKYVNTNAEGSYSLSGSIFLDYRNSRDFRDFNSILFGHHMEKETMFGEIGLFSDRAYFEARRYGSLYYDGADHGLEFFAFLHTDAYDSAVFLANVQGEEARQAYLDGLLGKAAYTREIGVTREDRIVLLSTCSSASTNGRDILVARITDDLEPNPFLTTNETDQAGIWPGADGQTGLWLWLAAAVPAVLILLMVVMYKRRSRIRQAGESKQEKE